MTLSEKIATGLFSRHSLAISRVGISLSLRQRTFCNESNPTSPFTILKLQDQDIGEFYVVQERRAIGFGCSKVLRGLVGSHSIVPCINTREVKKQKNGRQNEGEKKHY